MLTNTCKDCVLLPFHTQALNNNNWHNVLTVSSAQGGNLLIRFVDNGEGRLNPGIHVLVRAPLPHRRRLDPFDCGGNDVGKQKLRTTWLRTLASPWRRADANHATSIKLLVKHHAER